MKKQTVFVCLYFVVLVVLAALTFLLPAQVFSPNENRNLSQMPELTGDAVLSGTFQSDLSSFLSDQIPGREFWIGMNTSIKKLLGKQEINGVYLGKDGYYFQQFTEDSYSQNRMQGIFALMKSFAEKQSVPVTVMPVPTPGVVLADKLPANAPMYDADKAWSSLESALPEGSFIDLRQDFINAQQDLFYRTDHHWTAQGAYLAYKAYCAQQGISPKALSDFDLKTVSDQFYGTIYSKTLDTATKPDCIQAPQSLPELTVIFDGKETKTSLYDESKLTEKDKYAYFFGGNYGRVDIQTETQNGKRLLIIKDSFANSMVPYLLEDYERIIMIDLRYYSGKVSQVAEESGITEILFLYEMTNLLTDTGIAKLS